MTDFDPLMIILDYNTRKNLGLTIIESLYKDNYKEKLDSVETMQKLLNLIKPLLSESEANIEEDPYILESEQNEVSKMIFSVKSQYPEVIYEIYWELKNVFAYSGKMRRKLT